MSDKQENNSKSSFASEVQGDGNYSNYVNDPDSANRKKDRFSYGVPDEVLKDVEEGSHEDPFAAANARIIANRENPYQAQKRQRLLSPERKDAFSEGGSGAGGARSYKEIMQERELENERREIMARIQAKQKEEDEARARGGSTLSSSSGNTNDSSSMLSGGKRLQPDTLTDLNSLASEGGRTGTGAGAESTAAGSAGRSEWDATSDRGAAATSSKWDTPKIAATSRRWDTPKGASGAAAGSETPTPGRWVEPTPSRYGETPTPRRGGSAAGKSRWDDPGAMTPKSGFSSAPGDEATPLASSGFSGGMGITPTPMGHMDMKTPTPGQIAAMNIPLTRAEAETDERNRPLTDEELDAILPSEGYEIVNAPEGDKYQNLNQRAKLLATPTPMGMTPNYYSVPESTGKPYDMNLTPAGGEDGSLPLIKPEDASYFSALLKEVDEEQLSSDELKERKIMTLLLKVKNGTPPMRKSALRQLTDKARELGAGPLFNQILPLLMSPTLEDQERHLLVKVIDRIMFKLDELVRPFVHKILVVIEPLLIDEDYYARVEGREIISNLSKAAGLATMIATMRPDIDHNDEYVRNTTARAFAVVASALGVPNLIPFLMAVCKSKKSWRARHTGIKIVQQIAILMGCAILPHLKALVDIIEHGLKDEQQKVRTITALALAALAEAATPYGIEAFDKVLRPLWEGLKRYKLKGLAAFLKATGYIVPLMDDTHALHYVSDAMEVLKREFSSPDQEMKKIVLKVVKQYISADGIEAEFIKTEILPEFFANFWVRKMADERRNYRQLVDTTVEIANKVGGAEIIKRIVEDLKDQQSEQYRKMVMETIEKVVVNLGVADVDGVLEEALMDGILFAFQEQSTDDTMVMLNGFGAVVNCFGYRVKPYIPQICGTIQWRLNNKSAKVRQQAADLVARIASVMKTCGEETKMGRLGMILYEYLGEEYPEVLGSILGALKAIVNVIGMTKMTPSIKDLLPRLTPILKNRHEKVQENCIDLVGRIADRGPEYVPPKEWMRICFDLLDLLKAHKKGIRRATVNTFGYIAKAIGPQDVLATLLSNLRVQERQNRVCTTVAIAIVAETCGPFTVLPALMNEYRVPELNVQNGVLKSLSFMFEYIGEMGKDYIYAVTPLLEDALTDRDLVHRQTAASAVKHLTLGVAGLSCEDALTHLLNFVFPNIFETSPHVINAVTDSIEAMRVGLGSSRVLLYLLQGLFHPARRTREVYWRLYNMIYIGSQDALVQAFPDLSDEEHPEYRRTELEMFIQIQKRSSQETKQTVI